MIAEPILNAILHLFSITTLGLSKSEQELAHKKILSYLENHIGVTDTSTYIGLYQEFMELHQGEDDEIILKSTERIAIQLKTLLQESDKYVSIAYFAELAAISNTSLPVQILYLLGRTLSIEEQFVTEILQLLRDPLSSKSENIKLLLQNQLAAMRAPEKKLLFILPTNVNAATNESFSIDGHPLQRGRCYVFRPGQILLDKNRNALYFDLILNQFSETQKFIEKFFFQAKNVNYHFPKGGLGLHDFSCNESSGRMIGIMGASGAGKSTLLSILNGTLRPSSGEVLLNGHDIYSQSSESSNYCDGMIGHIPQDDLLFENLTVFENLYYAARLCLVNLSEDQLVLRVNELLEELGQSQTAHLKVGSPLEKTISGGQRKRLNIALELIRGPEVLFVDEPTSGLSSNDAENVMGLLKEQTARNKLVLVVIHQPSSKIYRMFDSLWILDQGGQLIFNGPPLEAIFYFRSRGDIPGAEEAICTSCGGTNPEQIFEIIESKTIDQNGKFTHNRRISPEKWRENYLQSLQHKNEDPKQKAHISSQKEPRINIPRSIHRPGRLGQFLIFFARDLRARMANMQYVFITLLTPMLLSLLIAVISRGVSGGNYSFYDNKNIHIFFFMSVTVALFLGLSVSAEEICRDRKNLKREEFLGLSWWSYINSKVFYLALVMALQMFLYTIIANYLLEIENFNFKTWLVLFLSAFASSVLGLNISAIFRSAVTIYILIPLILIPQMILSGAVIRYEELISVTSLKREVPFYTNIFFSRFAYEALLVEQYMGNNYMKDLVESDAIIRQAEYELDNYIPEVQSQNKSVILILEEKNSVLDLQKKIFLLKKEITELEKRTGIPFTNRNEIQIDKFGSSIAEKIDEYLLEYRKQTFERRKKASAQKREIEKKFKDELEVLKKRYTNNIIQRMMLNLDELRPVVATENGLYQNVLPVYKMPQSTLGNAHFLASKKRLGDFVFSTFTFNLLVLMILTFILYLALWVRGSGVVNKLFKRI